jgi:hypothetical protein
MSDNILGARDRPLRGWIVVLRGEFSMKTRSLVVFLAICLLARESFPGDKSRDWQTGTLISIEQGSESGPGMITSGVVVNSKYPTWVYVVETETMTYAFLEGPHGLPRRYMHPRPFTLGSQVKFVLGSKESAFLLDEKGKQFKVSVVKQTIRSAQPNN